ncbi:hypothetical protein [Anabaena sp. 4-3]|nr:hypothetical protein [Anabaena sp. 4-3]
MPKLSQEELGVSGMKISGNQYLLQRLYITYASLRIFGIYLEIDS